MLVQTGPGLLMDVNEIDCVFLPNTSVYCTYRYNGAWYMMHIWSLLWSLYPWRLASVVSNGGGDGHQVLSGHCALSHWSARAWMLVLGMGILGVTCVSIQKSSKAMVRPDKMCPFAPLKTQHPAETAGNLWHRHRLQSPILFWHVIQEDIMGYTEWASYENTDTGSWFEDEHLENGYPVEPRINDSKS